jgi:molecular chaperone DnaJ
MSTSFGNFDLYEELEITKESTPEQIKKAYKKLAMKWHPDKNSGNEQATEKFQRISHAYSILSDSKKKAYYDKYGTIDEDNFNFEEFMKNFKFDFNFDMFDGGDMFGQGFFDMGMAGPESRHNLKMMYTRKRAFNKPLGKTIQNNTDTNTENYEVNFLYLF